MSLKAMLEQSVRLYGKKTAIIMGEQRLSYADLDEASNKVADALKEMGIKKDDRVALGFCRSTGTPPRARRNSRWKGLTKSSALAI